MSAAKPSSLLQNSFLFLSLLLCVMGVCMAQYDDNSGSDSFYPQPASRTVTNEPQATITLTIPNNNGSESQPSPSDNGNDGSNSDSGSGNIPPVYVSALNLETSYLTNAEALQAISTNAEILLTAMAVVDDNNNPIPTTEQTTSTTELNKLTDITAENYHSLRVGFTTLEDAAKARSAIVNGLVPNVRLPVAQPTTGGLSERDKIIIGCVVGIGVPVLIAIALAIFCCCCRKKNSYGRGGINGYARPEFGDTALIDLDKEVTARLTPTVPIKQQQDHMMGVVEEVHVVHRY